MRLLVNIAIFATLLGVGNAVSIPTTRSSKRPQISTLEDIPKLPEGFTWDIKNRPKGDDTRTKTSSKTLNSRSDGLQKRAVTIDCSGHSGHPPIWDDCKRLADQLANYKSDILVDPGYCHQASFGTCLAYVCAKCEQITIDSDDWARVHHALIEQCVGNGESGYAFDPSADNFEVGIEHSGDELPPYQC
ncbi:hypothetical protein N7481_003837 [Penicillium waksmanii]|uniref:uncharacterized protein n=1 Tax=Penicillium waksmanii TaxID=69791 RepID=UPI0025472808|nr:uncharacterized protein N7481_003837 [Penicillium waksmanii]KAJ5988627.1 hypothetical protein N7481_003837 [Penicillium waksmanii]